MKTATKKAVPQHPSLRNYIIQPNRVTNSVADYTLYQERIFTAIIYHLQEPIQMSFRGENYKQLTLFSSDMINLIIPLNHISKPREYKKVKEAIIQMASVQLAIKYVDEQGHSREKYGGLFIADVPEKGDWKGIVKLKIDKSVAELLIKLDKNRLGKPIKFTRFSYDVARTLNTKHAARIYKLISSWKAKGEFWISKDELYTTLGIEGKYPRFSDFKARVLLPAYKELFEKADCWFDIDHPKFVMRTGREVTGFYFKVITHEAVEADQNRIDGIRNILKTHFNCSDIELEPFNEIFNRPTFNYGMTMQKIMELNEKMDNTIKNKSKYVIASLLNFFNEQKV